jgi:hypothetical protein
VGGFALNSKPIIGSLGIFFQTLSDSLSWFSSPSPDIGIVFSDLNTDGFCPNCGIVLRGFAIYILVRVVHVFMLLVIMDILVLLTCSLDHSVTNQ